MILALSHFLQAMVFTVRNAPGPLPGSKKTTNATKMLPKIGLKALGHKGFKIGSIWDGYRNATSGTFQHEKRRFFHAPARFCKIFSHARGVTLPLHHVTLHSIRDNLPQQKPDGKMAAIYEALRTSFFKERKGGRK